MKRLKKAMRAIALTLAVCISVPSIPTQYAKAMESQQKAITEADFLKADGKNLVNQAGEVVNLRGTNAGGYLIQEFWMTPTLSTDGVKDEERIYQVLTDRFGKDKMLNIVNAYQDAYWTEQDFDNCASLGMNVIRLPFWWRNLVDENGVFYGYDESLTVSDGDVSGNSTSGNDVSGNQIGTNSGVVNDPYAKAFARMDWFVEEAAQRGMYVIIDFHGAPGSQNGSDHSGVDGENAKEEASEFFFGENAGKNQELYYRIWKVIAERYADNPAVAAYDLLNEPYCTYRYNSKLSADALHTMLWDIYDKAYRTIREMDPDHVVIMEATWDPVDLPNPAQYGWENVMYEYHNYLYDDYDNANGQQIANMQTKLNAIGNTDYEVPSYMGEFSYFNSQDAWDQGLKLLTESGMNWTTWTYKTVNSYGMWGQYHHPAEFDNKKINLETASYDEIMAFYSRMGESEENTTLTSVTSKWYQAPVAPNQLEPKYASLEDGRYYVVGNNALRILTRNESTSLIAATSDLKTIATGSAAPFTLQNNEDGTVSLMADNGKYLSVSNDDLRIFATASEITKSEKFYVLEVSPTLVAFKSAATGTYVSVVNVKTAEGQEKPESLDVFAQSFSITGDESFQLYDQDLHLVGSPQLDTYSGWTRYESEDDAVASIHGDGAKKEQQSFYSKGYAAGNMNSATALADVASDWSNIKYVEFTVDVETAGTYLLSLNYNGNDNKEILVKVNHGEQQVISVPNVPGGQWDTMFEKVISVDLKEGSNVIDISGTINNQGWMNLDCMDLINSPLTKNDVYTRYEAENYYTNASVKPQTFYSQGKGVENVNSDTKLDDVAFNWSNIKYVDFTVYAEEAGEYNVVWGYTGAGTNGMKALYRVNHGENQVITLDNKGGNWNVPSTYTFTVDLEKGFNSLQISGTIENQDHYANIDYIDVKLSSVQESEKGPSGWTRYEAEKAAVTGGANEAQDFYSMGLGVGNLNVDNITVDQVAEDWSNINYVTFKVNAPRTGDYRLVMAYNGDDDKFGLIKVNDGADKIIALPAVTDSHAWDMMHEKPMVVTLQEGENTISISGAIGEGWYNIDYIEVCNSEIVVLDEETQTERYEAEFYQTKSANSPAVESQHMYSGPDQQGVGGMGATCTYTEGIDVLDSGLNYTEFTLYVKAAGKYKISLATNGAEGDALGVYQVNTQESKTYEIHNSDAGYSWDRMCTSEFTVDLQKGYNRLLMAGTYDGSWLNMDYMDVTPVDVVIEGKIECKTEVEDGTTDVKFADSASLKDVVLSNTEKALVEAGANATITLEVMELANPSEEDRNLIQDALADQKIGCYLDINLWKQIGDKQPIQVTETAGKVKITIAIPEELRKAGRTFSVIYVHNGAATALEDLDEDPSAVTIETDQFSTYALVYTEENNNQPGGGQEPGGNNNKPGGGQETGGNNSKPGDGQETGGNNSKPGDGQEPGGNNTPSETQPGGSNGNNNTTPTQNPTNHTTDQKTNSAADATVTALNSAPKTNDTNWFLWVAMLLVVGVILGTTGKYFMNKKDKDFE